MPKFETKQTQYGGGLMVQYCSKPFARGNTSSLPNVLAASWPRWDENKVKAAVNLTRQCLGKNIIVTNYYCMSMLNIISPFILYKPFNKWICKDWLNRKLNNRWQLFCFADWQKFLFLHSEHVQFFCHAKDNNRGATEIVSLLFVLLTSHS